MFSPEQLRSVLKHWETRLQRLATSDPFTANHAQRLAMAMVPVGTGLSGGEVFRVELGESDPSVTQDRTPLCFALKAWPSGTTGEHVERVAAIVRSAASQCGLLAPPLLRPDSDSPFAHDHGRYWELARWIPGSPLPANASAEAIACGGEAIARVHAAMNPISPLRTSGCGTPGTPWVATTMRANRPHVPRCIVDRISRIQSVTPLLDRIASQTWHQDELAARLATQLKSTQQGSPASAFDCEMLARTLNQASTSLARQWPAVEPNLVARLRQHGRECAELPSNWVLRDVHREHVLFDRDQRGDLHRVQGILDYDAVDYDSPAVDLARWAGDFESRFGSAGIFTGRLNLSGGHAEHSPLHAAVAGYRTIRPFSKCEWKLAETLIEANRVGGLANWLMWLVLERRRFGASAEQIQGRISHLIAADGRTW